MTAPVCAATARQRGTPGGVSGWGRVCVTCEPGPALSAQTPLFNSRPEKSIFLGPWRILSPVPKT